MRSETLLNATVATRSEYFGLELSKNQVLMQKDTNEGHTAHSRSLIRVLIFSINI